MLDTQWDSDSLIIVVWMEHKASFKQSRAIGLMSRGFASGSGDTVQSQVES